MWLTAGLCCLLWGSAFPAIRKGYELLDIQSGDTPSILLFAGVRFTLAGALTVAIFSIINRAPLLPSRSAVKKICVLSVFQTVLQYVFFYLGLAFTTGSRGSVISSTGVFFSLLISALIFKFEKLNIRKIIGCAVGFVGVVLVSLDAFGGGSSLIGEGFILLSAIAYAFSCAFMKSYSENENPAMLSGWQFFLGGLVMTAVGIAFGGRLGGVSIKAVLLIVYLALVSAVAYSLWSILLRYNEVSSVAVCGFMTPVFGFILSSLISDGGNGAGLISVAALALVVIGIITVNFEKNKRDIKNY